MRKVEPMIFPNSHLTGEDGQQEGSVPFCSRQTTTWEYSIGLNQTQQSQNERKHNSEDWQGFTPPVD